MKRYDLYILDSTKTVVASMQDAAWELSESLNVEDSLRAVMYEGDKFALVTAENTYVRLVNAADSTDKRTYRLTSVEQAHVEGRYALQVEGARIWADMGREIYTVAYTNPLTGLVRQVGWLPKKNIEVKTIVTDILNSSAFQIKSGGSAASNTTIVESLDFAFTSVLEGLQRVAEANNLEIEIDESTSPESIDLKARGANNNVRFEYGINTKGMARRFRRADVVNKVYPVGGGTPPATCEGALFEVYGTASAVVTVAGDKCIPSDDTYNTFKIEMVTGANAGTAYTINDTTRGTSGDDDTITLSVTPTGVLAGDLFKITDASGNDLSYVPDAASQATYGTFDGVVRDAQFEAIRTLITPGYMDGTYTTGLHSGWTKTGTPTVAEETTIAFIQHGKASQHVTAASDTHGIYNDVALDGSAHYTCAVNLYVVSGSVLITISTAGATGAVTYTNTPGTTGTEWLKVELEGLPIEGAAAKLTIAATGGAAEFYVDAVSFTGTQQTRQFVRENGARELYRMAFDYLDEHDAPMVEYDLPNALDLYAIDSRAYPFADVAIGDTVTVIDPAMSMAAAVRVLSLGRDSNGTQLRLKLSSHTSTLAAFSLVAPGVGRVIVENRNNAQEVTNTNSTNETAGGIAERINRMTGNAARASRFTGTFTAASQTSVVVGAGTLQMGSALAYDIAGQTISGLSGATVYYLYFNPTAASSGLQTTATAATAYAANNIQVGILQTGATANDNVQIYDTTGAVVHGEIITRGMEAYDTSGVLRVDVGILQDVVYSNPSDWGVAVNNGVMWIDATGAAAITSGTSYAWRAAFVTMDISTPSTAAFMFGDAVQIAAQVALNKGLFGSFDNVTLAAGSAGHGYAHTAQVQNAGTGNAYGYRAQGVTTAGAGNAIGLAIETVSNSSTGNAYGIHIATVTSTSGTAYGIYDASNNRSYFGGSVSIRGVDYVWPAADGTATYQLATDGSGNLSWAASSGGGTVTGTGTNNYVPLWTSASALGNSVIQQSGSNVGIGGTPTCPLNVFGGTVGTPSLRLDAAVYPMMDFFSASADVSNRNWRIASVYNAFGSMEIMHSTTSGGLPTTTLMRLDGVNARVGIGMTPARTLDVTGTFGATGAGYFGGNVGIGTSPSSRLHIRDDGGGAQLRLDYLGSSSTIFASTHLYLQPNGTTAMTLLSGGNVGIGTTAPSYRLDIRENTTAGSMTTDPIVKIANSAGASNWTTIHLTDTTTADAFIGFYSGATASDRRMVFAVQDTSESLVIMDNGNVGIGMTPARTLDVTGTFGATGAGYFGGNVGIGGTPTCPLNVFGGTVGTPSLRLDAAIYPMLDFFSAYVHASNRNWRIASVYNGVGHMEIMHSNTAGGVPTTTLMRLDGVNARVGILMTPARTLDVTGTFGATGAGYIGGNLGVGVTPSYLLHIGSGSTPSGTPSVHIATTSASGTSISGISVSPLATAAIATSFIGAIINPQVSWVGTQAEVKSLWIAPQFGASNTITNYYGLYIQDSATGTVTNGWAIYSLSAEDSYIKGDVGIGIAAPLSTLHVYDSAPGSTTGIRTENNSGSDWGMGELVFNNTFSIYDFGASDGRLNITSGGDCGIGTQTPSNRLHVVKNDPAANVNIGLFDNSKTTTTNASKILSLTFSGVDPNDANHAFLWMVGSVTARAYITSNGAYYGNGSYLTISDRRLKFDETTPESYVDKFMMLEYKNYRMIDKPELKMFGLVAQDVELIFPSLVENSVAGYKVVNSSIIHEIGMSVLQDNMRRTVAVEFKVETIAEKVARLETENADLLGRVELLEAA